MFLIKGALMYLKKLQCRAELKRLLFQIKQKKFDVLDKQVNSKSCQVEEPLYKGKEQHSN